MGRLDVAVWEVGVVGDVGVAWVVGVCDSSGGAKRLFLKICFAGLGDISCASAGWITKANKSRPAR
ncbi:MAG TPA: hypothetical protein VE642_10180 [Pyrinomonadaceae bacterium]|nr:hypothetical protein [Pyrinomonadaceae bacterium]